MSSTQIAATHECCLCLLTAAPECRPVLCLHIYLLAVYGNYINMQNNEKRCSMCVCVCVCVYVNRARRCQLGLFSLFCF